MKSIFAIFMLISFLVSGLGCSDSKENAATKPSGDSESASDTEDLSSTFGGAKLYGCTDENANALVRTCLVDEPRATQLTERIIGWANPVGGNPDYKGQWLSYHLLTDQTHKYFALTTTEIDCLTKALCQREIP